MEMRSALRCVLTYLADLHKQGWTHLNLCWPNVVFVAQNQWFVIDAEFARPIGSEMPKGFVLGDPDATVADEMADCFLVGVMMQDPRCLLNGIESAQKLAEFLCLLESCILEPGDLYWYVRVRTYVSTS